ncbi:MAG: 3-deoxy-D-manno-octulosonic acid kinase [Spiribacter sp.]|nr:3-deoxy-D-manno-octulosonic acid kinase [Spiribacter sp.]
MGDTLRHKPSLGNRVSGQHLKHDFEVQHQGSEYLIRPAQSSPPEWMGKIFNPEALASEGLIEGRASGRASAWFFRLDRHPLVLRHYCRGGAVAHISHDRYLWRGLKTTRAWHEIKVLTALQRLDLPVPAPIGARVVRHGLTYTADIVMRRIESSQTLADLAVTHHHTDGLPWASIGRTIRRFHDQGVGHADLNIRNILIDEAGCIWLIDWDRGELQASARFQARSLVRLQRSIDKEPALREAGAQGFAALMHAYGES